jgi:hypothetical protein
MIAEAISLVTKLDKNPQKSAKRGREVEKLEEKSALKERTKNCSKPPENPDLSVAVPIPIPVDPSTLPLAPKGKWRKQRTSGKLSTVLCRFPSQLGPGLAMDHSESLYDDLGRYFSSKLEFSFVLEGVDNMTAHPIIKQSIPKFTFIFCKWFSRMKTISANRRLKKSKHELSNQKINDMISSGKFLDCISFLTDDAVEWVKINPDAARNLDRRKFIPGLSFCNLNWVVNASLHNSS